MSQSIVVAAMNSLVQGVAERWTLGSSVLLLLCVLTLFTYAWVTHRWTSAFESMRDISCSLPLPPGSMGWPFVGETLEFMRKGGEFYASRLRALGPVYKTHLIGSPIVRLVGGENMRHVMMGEHVIVRSSWPKSVQRLVGPHSLLGMSGEDHRKVKPLIGALFSPRVLSSFVPRIQAIVNRHLDQWCQTSATEGQVLGFPSCQRLSLDLSLEITLGQDSGRNQDLSLMRAMKQFVANLFSLPVAIPGCGMWKGLRARERILQEVRHKLDATESRSDTDFLSIVELMQSDPTMSARRQLIEDNALELFFASYSTTSSSLCSALLCMGRNPEALQKVEEELEEEGLLEDRSKELNYDVVERLHYVHSCNSEVLRVYPPAGAVFRRALRTLQIGGFQVPKDWLLASSIRETQHTSKLFPDAERFLPDRWMHMSEELKERSRFEYLPFGVGARLCVGRRLAILTQAVFLVEVVRRCRYELKSPHPQMVFIPIAKPKDDLPVVFRSRLDDPSISRSSC